MGQQLQVIMHINNIFNQFIFMLFFYIVDEIVVSKTHLCWRIVDHLWKNMCRQNIIAMG